MLRSWGDAPDSSASDSAGNRVVISGWYATSVLVASAPIRTPSPVSSIAASPGAASPGAADRGPARPVMSMIAVGRITSSRIRSTSVVPPARKLAPPSPAAAIAARASAGRT